MGITNYEARDQALQTQRYSESCFLLVKLLSFHRGYGLWTS